MHKVLKSGTFDKLFLTLLSLRLCVPEEDRAFPIENFHRTHLVFDEVVIRLENVEWIVTLWDIKSLPPSKVRASMSSDSAFFPSDSHGFDCIIWDSVSTHCFFIIRAIAESPNVTRLKSRHVFGFVEPNGAFVYLVKGWDIFFRNFSGVSSCRLCL
jgi:hypothetical protein